MPFTKYAHYYSTQKARIHRLSREAAWIVAGQVASVLGALVLVRVLTEYLQPAEYGELALGLTIAGLVNQVVMGGISNGIGRYYSIASEKKQLPSYLRASFKLLFYSTLVVIAIAALLTGGLVALDQSQWINLALIVLLFSIVGGYNGVLNGIQNAARQRAVVALHSGFDAWLKIAFAVGIILWFGVSSAAVILGYFLSALLITASQLFFLKYLMRKASPSSAEGDSHEPWAHLIWTFSWPFSAWGIFTWMYQVSDRWALQSFATKADIGQYTAVFQLGYAPVGLVTGMMLTLIAPILYKRSGDAKDRVRNQSAHQALWKIIRLGLLVTAIAFLGSAIFHNSLFSFLVAKDYQSVSYLLPWVVLAGGLFSVGQTLSLRLMFENKTNRLLNVKVTTALLGILANLFGAYFLGIEGVVAALLFYSIIFFLWNLAIAKSADYD